MKHLTTIMLCLSTFFFASCKGDDPAPMKKFADYTRADILAEEANLTKDAVTFDAQGVPNFKPGSIIFFKTSDVNYGKLEVLEVKANSDLIVNLVVYNAAGTALLTKTNFTLVLSLIYYDIDDPAMPMVDSPSADFGWSELVGIKTLIFGNNAKAYLFKP